jgi:hypothetical protein
LGCQADGEADEVSGQLEKVSFFQGINHIRNASRGSAFPATNFWPNDDLPGQND